MKVIQGILLLVAIGITNGAEAKLQCKGPHVNVPKDWITMVPPCIQKMRDQVEIELRAAVTYLAMGAHFSRDVVNRPGFAKMFFEHANEEREHAMKVIAYLLMRGELTSDVAKLIRNPMPLKEHWESGVAALKDALKLETEVTNRIRSIIMECETPQGETFNDYHLVDYLTGDFLEEQYKGQRDLAGKISTLDKMMESHGALGEFLFDKKLLKGQPV
ncbi:ferritin heavy chain [Bacillus rossius redtenbacheri]|uniref:ferritin heavy chain n=1 Tax=Bacillus rossius redtenbacheri TaxID=93214 RepID=UPI002FDDFF26